MTAFRHSIFAASLMVFSASAGLAAPSDVAEMRQLVATRYGGDVLAYVSGETEDFRKIACDGRADMIKALIDDGLALESVPEGTHIEALSCALRKKESGTFALLLTPDRMTAWEFAERRERNKTPLFYAMLSRNYANVRAMLENGVHDFYTVDNYTKLTREEQLLSAAKFALDVDKNSVRALQDAGFGYLLEAARNKENIRYLRARGSKDGGGASGSGGGGGGLFGAVLGGVGGAALGGSTGAAIGALMAMGGSGEEDSDGARGDPSAAPLRLPTRRAELDLGLAPVAAPGRGFEVKQVTSGGAGARAGLAAGDVIVGIAGMPVASRGSFYVATEAAFEAESFDVEYLRGGVLNRTVFRKALPAAAVAAAPKASAVVAPAPVPPSAPAVAVDMSSRLEELAKLGDLRDRGIVSDAEFETMKARIMGGVAPAPSAPAPSAPASASPAPAPAPLPAPAPSSVAGAAVPIAYGIRMGQPLDSLDVQEDWRGMRYLVTPPVTDPEIFQLAVQATPETGVCRVQMFGRSYVKDFRGRAVLAAFERYRTELDAKFGPGKETDTLKAGSEYTRPTSYAVSIFRKERQRKILWKPGVGSGYSAVAMEVSANYPTDPFIYITYEFANFDRCIEINKAAQARIG